jgi:hypothetical protein
MKRRIRASTLVMVFNYALSSSHFGELDFEDANWVEELNSRLLINSMSIPNLGVGPGDPLVNDITVRPTGSIRRREYGVGIHGGSRRHIMR